MTEQNRITTCNASLIVGSIYEADGAETLKEALHEKNEVVTRSRGNYWRHNSNDIKATFPIAMTQNPTWSNFWNRFALYVTKTNSGQIEDKSTQLQANDFVYVDYLGPDEGKKVYACSPSKGLYTLTMEASGTTATRVLEQGCCHINYSRVHNKFLICSDNRTSIGAASKLIIWDGTPNGGYNAYEYKVDNVAAPFNISAYGVLCYSGGSRVYGFHLGAATYNGPHNRTGFGGFYVVESVLSGTSYPITRGPGYYYLNGDEDNQTPDNNGQSEEGPTSNRYICDDIKFMRFDGLNLLWVVACGGNTYGSFNNHGEDVLISQVGNDSVQPFYRFRFSNNSKQKMYRVLQSSQATWNYKKADSSAVLGTGIGLICSHDNGTPVVWFPSDFHPYDERFTTYEDDNFKLPVCQLDGANNDQWLSAVDAKNFLIVSGSSQLCYSPFAQTNTEPVPKNMTRVIRVLPNSSTVSDAYSDYIDAVTFGNDTYFCASGGLIRAENLATTDDLNTVTFHAYDIKDKTGVYGVQILSVTHDEDYIYAVGVASDTGQAVIIKPSDDTAPVATNGVITTVDFNKTVGTIGDIYAKIHAALDAVKNGYATDPSGMPPGSSRTWTQIRSTLLASGDQDIIDRLNA